MKPEINIVSLCCSASIEKGVIHDRHPLPRNEYNGVGIMYSIDVCSGCHREAEAAKACGICGEVGCENQCEVTG